MDILVVVDTQNDFISGSLGTPEAQAIVSKVADKIRNWEGDIFCTYDTHDEYYLESFEGVKLPIKHCIKGKEGWVYPEEIMQALKNAPDGECWIVEKGTFGSFDLVDLINRYSKIDTITVVGLCTDICVITNCLLLRTAFPDVEIYVDSSCCAGVTPETHEAALTVMKSCQINII